MASGLPKLVINTRERAVSDDISRVQAFSGFGLAEIMRAMALIEGSFDFPAAGETLPTYGDSPLPAVVLNGLMAVPGDGTSAMGFTAGSALIYSNDGSPDDNPLRIVFDPGLSVTGGNALNLTANSSGSTRIDVIECRAVETNMQTDSRDVYDEESGGFVPQSVVKVVQHQLQYRIRLGTPGGGFPGWAAGYMPIAVARVPNGVATWTNCTIWDVRRLMSDYWNAPCRTSRTMVRLVRNTLHAIRDASAPNHTLVMGETEVEWLTNRVGGLMQNTPADSLFVDVQNADVNALGTPVNSYPWYLYLVHPFGIKNWRKYGATGTPRVPQGPAGIPVASQSAPYPYSGRPSLDITLPVALGLGGTSNEAVAVGAGWIDGAANVRGWYSDGAWSRSYYLHEISYSGAYASTHTFTLQSAVDFPSNARSVRIAASVGFTGFTSKDDEQVSAKVTLVNGSGNLLATLTDTHLMGGNATDMGEMNVDFEFDLPVDGAQSAWPIGNYYVKFALNSSVDAPSGIVIYMRVLGWRLTD